MHGSQVELSLNRIHVQHCRSPFKNERFRQRLKISMPRRSNHSNSNASSVSPKSNSIPGTMTFRVTPQHQIHVVDHCPGPDSTLPGENTDLDLILGTRSVSAETPPLSFDPQPYSWEPDTSWTTTYGDSSQLDAFATSVPHDPHGQIAHNARNNDSRSTSSQSFPELFFHHMPPMFMQQLTTSLPSTNLAPPLPQELPFMSPNRTIRGAEGWGSSFDTTTSHHRSDAILSQSWPTMFPDAIDSLPQCGPTSSGRGGYQCDQCPRAYRQPCQLRYLIPT